MFWASLRRSAMRRRMRFILTRVSAREASPAAGGAGAGAAGVGAGAGAGVGAGAGAAGRRRGLLGRRGDGRRRRRGLGGALGGRVDLEERLADLHHGIHLREVLRDRAGDGRPHLDAHLVRLDDDDDVVDGHAVADLRRPLDDGALRDGVAHARHGDVFHAQQPREPAERRLLRFLGEGERELPGGIAHSNGPCGAKARAARAR